MQLEEHLRSTTIDLFSLAGLLNTNARWHGTVEPGGRFRLQPLLGSGRNSWLPVCQGTPVPDGAGSRVDIELDAHPFQYAFAACWSFPCLVMLCGGMCGPLFLPRPEQVLIGLAVGVGIPSGFLGLHAALIAVGVRAGRRLARRRFAELGTLEA